MNRQRYLARFREWWRWNEIAFGHGSVPIVMTAIVFLAGLALIILEVV